MGFRHFSKIPLILRPQAWLHRRHYGEVLSPIRWWQIRLSFIWCRCLLAGWSANADRSIR